MDSQTKDKIVKPDAEWRQQLTPEQYKVTRKHGTERAFSGAYWDNHEPGVYRCVCCGEPVFDAETKFDSGTGWPSFYQPTSAAAVETETDRSLFMTRTEVHCARCAAHLGHVFRTGRSRPACVIASIRPRSGSSRGNRARNVTPASGIHVNRREACRTPGAAASSRHD